MRARTCILALVVAAAATAAGCDYPYGSSRHDYGPSFQRVPGYDAGSGGAAPAQSGYASKWDYYRNYQGSFRTPPERP